jgi:AraC-like DNA-binding protein/quercetin dioxygenase-like cupin family protein
MATRSPRIRDGFPGQRMVVVPRDVAAQCRRMPVVQDLHVLAIGNFPAAQHHYIQRREGLAEAILIHCTRGRGWCRLAGKKWAVDEGQAIFIPPGEPHAYGADELAPWSINWVHFGGRRAAAYLDALGVTPAQPLLNLPDAPVLTQAFEELCGVLQLGYTESSLLALATELGRFLGMLKIHQRAFYHKGRQAEEKIFDSMAFMRANLEKSLPLEALAGQVHMSVPHYCALFKRLTNTSPILFLIRLKMQQACELLTTTGLAVDAVGQAVGYEDQFYFCRVFKKTIGLAPSAYRRTSLEMSK